MAGILVVFKRQRPSFDVEFFDNAQFRRQDDLAKIAAFASETMAGPLTHIRTVYFFSADDYSKWEQSPVRLELKAERDAYQAQMGITELKEVISLTVV
jgi:hypothetical protein